MAQNTFLFGSSIPPMQVLQLCLGLVLHLGLGFRKPTSPELQRLCSYKIHATGNTRFPKHGYLHTFLLASSLTFIQVSDHPELTKKAAESGSDTTGRSCPNFSTLWQQWQCWEISATNFHSHKMRSPLEDLYWEHGSNLPPPSLSNGKNKKKIVFKNSSRYN